MIYEVQGQKGILIQLDKYPEEITQTSSGILIPQYKNYETDGGRPAAALEKEVWSTVGTVLQISPRAKEDLEREKISLFPGDKIYIQPAAKHPHNWFFSDRMTRIQDYEGLLLITAAAIQAIVHETPNEQ